MTVLNLVLFYYRSDIFIDTTIKEMSNKADAIYTENNEKLHCSFLNNENGDSPWTGFIAAHKRPFHPRKENAPIQDEKSVSAIEQFHYRSDLCGTGEETGLRHWRRDGLSTPCMTSLFTG